MMIDIQDKLAKKLKIYIKAIINEYRDFIPKARLKYLINIKDFNSIIKIYDYGSINGISTHSNICLPLNVNSVFNELKKLPNYASNKKHKLYDKSNLVINDNTFFDYFLHVIISGMDTLDYYEDLLLHEAMHFCGVIGYNSIKEGICEYLTRKLALKYNFKTNGCAYYKEVFIVYKLEKILGEDILNRIAFISDENKTFEFLSSFVNKDISNLYKEVSSTMEKESYYKYKIYFNNFDGISGVNEKIKRYDDIDYSKVLNIFSKYDNSLQK